MKFYSNRLAVLSDEERIAMYDIPDFDKEQQHEHFNFSEDELNFILSRTNLSARIYCALQIGYFKAKQIFFEMSWTDISSEDIDFIINKYFDGRNISLRTITQYEHYTQINQIAKLHNYKLWSSEFTEPLYLNILNKSRKDTNIKFILSELLGSLHEKRIVRPNYSTLQKIISKALNDEQNRLESIIVDSITEESKNAIEKLLRRDDILSYLAVLKQDAKNFGYKMMTIERKKLLEIKPLYLLAKELLPKLDISRQNLIHYAELVDYYTIYDLRRLSQASLHLYLICYTWQRYMQLTDNLAAAFGYHLKQFYDETKENAEDVFTNQSRSQQGKMPLVGKLLQLYVDKNISDDVTFGEIRKKYAFALMQEETLYQTANQMIHKPISEHTLKWKAVDKIGPKFKKHLRATFIELDFTSVNPNNPFLNIVTQLKQCFLTQKSLNKSNFEDHIDIIPKKLRQHLLIMDSNNKITGVQPNRFEFWVYQQVSKYLESGEFYLDDSISHRCFEHELVSINDNEISQLNLPSLQRPIEEQLDELCKELKEAWGKFNEMLKNNKMKHIEYNTATKTVSFHKPRIVNTEEAENNFYSKITSLDITDVIRFVNDKCKFLSALTPLQSKYTKSVADVDSLLAVVISQAMNHGKLKLAKISDIPYHHLSDIYYQYFRKSTLQEADKIISNALKELPIFQFFSFDLTTLYGSVDGQKLGVKTETIKARHSKKYFGKGKGLVSYGMLVNHNLVSGKPIGSNEHESYFVFDIYYNNITDIIPEAITGDMHSINKANFALLHWFNVDFRPRFTDLETQLKHLYCGDELAEYQDYLVKPVGKIDRDLIVEEWNPKIKQIILTLANKETTQNKLIKKLCTYKQSRTLKAIFEFDKLVRSIYTLKYLMDYKLQQDVHRSQNRIESFHQLRAAIAQVNGKKQLIGKTDIEIGISNQCGILVANAIIYFNSVLLSLILEKYQDCNNNKAIERLKKISPVAWQHIHLLGHYMFCSNKHPIDLENILSILELY